MYTYNWERLSSLSQPYVHFGNIWVPAALETKEGTPGDPPIPCTMITYLHSFSTAQFSVIIFCRFIIKINQFKYRICYFLQPAKRRPMTSWKTWLSLETHKSSHKEYVILKPCPEAVYLADVVCRVCVLHPVGKIEGVRWLVTTPRVRSFVTELSSRLILLASL